MRKQVTGQKQIAGQKAGCEGKLLPPPLPQRPQPKPLPGAVRKPLMFFICPQLCFGE